MPIYSYECAAGHHAEEIHSVSSRPETIKCPVCGKSAHRVFDVPAIKVGGVYKNGGRSFGDAMRKMNDRAAERQKGRRPMK